MALITKPRRRRCRLMAMRVKQRVVNVNANMMNTMNVMSFDDDDDDGGDGHHDDMLMLRASSLKKNNLMMMMLVVIICFLSLDLMSGEVSGS